MKKNAIMMAAIIGSALATPAHAQKVYEMPSLSEMGAPTSSREAPRPEEAKRAKRSETLSEFDKRRARELREYDAQRAKSAERGRDIWLKEQAQSAKDVEKQRKEYRKREKKRIKELKRNARKFQKNNKIKRIKAPKRPKTLPPNATEY